MSEPRVPRWLRLLVCWEVWTAPVAIAVSLATSDPVALDLGVVTLSEFSLVTVGTLALVVARDALEPIRAVPALGWAVGTTLLFVLTVVLSPVPIAGVASIAAFVAAALLLYPLVYTLDYRSLVGRDQRSANQSSSDGGDGRPSEWRQADDGGQSVQQQGVETERG